ncbi:hypothetical protein B5X24_HaOG204149 [Helicoverpa armigera]|uniref:Uncharacterized protein n=1 Tax=Helicoverpa armigera TaxID=29058 RepID=A0A2W1BR10_HELAM|nr:hypothetical protein B5X24_HaOG204149 [Helicoverpa armigera]
MPENKGVPAWEEHRRVLVEALGGGDLSRPGLGQAMVSASASFCEAVMLGKEEAERQRVRTSHPGRRAGAGNRPLSVARVVPRAPQSDVSNPSGAHQGQDLPGLRDCSKDRGPGT